MKPNSDQRSWIGRTIQRAFFIEDDRRQPAQIEAALRHRSTRATASVSAESLVPIAVIDFPLK